MRLTETDTEDNPLQPLDGLYGEGSAPERAWHLESIAARSQAQNWRIAAHRHRDLWQLIRVRRGAVRARIDARETAFDGPALIVLPPGVMHGFVFAPNIEGQVLSLARDAVLEWATRKPALAILLERPQLWAIEADDRDDQRLHGVLGALAAEPSPTPWGCDDGVAEALAAAALGLLARIALARSDATPRAPGADARLSFARLQALVDTHYRDNWRAEDYASALNCSLSRLNRWCQSQSGYPIGALVRERRLTEAKRALHFSRLSIAQIAESLGFADAAYFARQFRRSTGQSPREWRAARAR